MTRTRLLRRLGVAAAATAVIIGLAVAAVWFSQRPSFALQRIDVRGDLRHVTEASLRAAIAGRLKGNYFTIRLDETRRLLETVPWVAAVSVRRAWPNRLVVTLTEHRALGVWGNARLLSDAGVVFVANPAEAEIDGPLPVFDGPVAAAAEAARRYRAFSAQLAPLGLSVVGIDISDRRSWRLRLAAGEGGSTELELGRGDDADALDGRLERIVAAYPMVVARLGRAPERIDARYPNGFAVSSPANTR